MAPRCGRGRPCREAVESAYRMMRRADPAGVGSAGPTTKSAAPNRTRPLAAIPSGRAARRADAAAVVPATDRRGVKALVEPAGSAGPDGLPPQGRRPRDDAAGDRHRRTSRDARGEEVPEVEPGRAAGAPVGSGATAWQRGATRGLRLPLARPRPRLCPWREHPVGQVAGRRASLPSWQRSCAA
jgi:hypothetical protein